MAAPNSNFIPYFNPNPNQKQPEVEAVILDSNNGDIINNGVLTSYSVDIPTFFNPNSSYVEISVHDVITQELLQYGDYNIKFYSLETTPSSSQATIDPSVDINFIIPSSYFTGEYAIESDLYYLLRYYFLDLEIGNWNSKLYISEISSDRQELRLDSLDINDFTLANQTNNFIQKRIESPYFLNFYLNFGLGNLVECINIKLDNIPGNSTVLVKLKEPLPEDIELNDTLWIVSQFSEPQYYKVSLPYNPPILQDTENLKSPNFNLSIKDQVNNSTLESSYLDIITSPLTSSQYQLNSILEETQLDINLDYTDFSNFIHFSSAQTRLENFYYKISLIEQYSSSISILTNSPSSPGVNNSITSYESKINNLITNFDGYEYYLYYESGSWAWPKLNTEPPYQLAPSNSPQVISWLGNGNEDSPLYSGILASASIYDSNNRDNLKKSIPEYLRDDPSNEPYELFIDMVAQHYDSVWVYIKDVVNKYDNDNRLNFGISRDLVADAIRDFGVKLYQNNFSNEDLYTAFLGLTPEGGLFPFPNITGSLPTPSGFEYIDQFISASNDYIPLDDVNKSLYKRIYHNLPYLLKSKGTLSGLRALITSYGIPDTILRINEFGGKDKINSNDWDAWQNEFNYAFYTTGSNFISSSWEVNTNWGTLDGIPNSLMFRFKTNGLPESNIPYSQSLVSLYQDPLNDYFKIILTYTGSGYVSGSYSGSIQDPYYQYATLTIIPEISTYSNLSASIYLPFFDGNWWSVMVNRETSNFTIYAGNKIYEGGDNNTVLGFYSTSSILSDDTGWAANGNLFFASSSTFNGITYTPFSGSLQEIRYYKNPISESVFKDYIMNPYSIEGNSLNSSPDELIFRAPLGGELYTGSVSIHPKITGSWITTQSFVSNSDFYFDQTPTFVPNEEYFFYDQPIAGIKNIISDKIRIENNVMPEGDTLSPFMSLSQMANISQSYTQNINYLEVAFSPQNEINEDIMDQIGSFNIGEYIGDPRLRSSSAVTYPALDQLRNEYFQKYISNYNLTDFIRLIKFFDNSLFKMIRDFVPARTSLASGIVVKQHLLERNKYPQPQVEWENLDISGTLKPQWNNYNEGTVEHFEGGAGGVVNPFNYINNVSQSWLENLITPSGSVLVLHNSQDEFYNGEYSGSTILISDGILNESYPISNQSFDYKQIRYFGGPESGLTVSNYNTNQSIFENLYLNPITSPQNGEILFFEKITNFNILGPERSPKYLKIAKIDCNGKNNTTVLGQIDTALIYTGLKNLTTLTFEYLYLKHNLIVLNEYPTYYLYEVISTKYPDNTDVSYILPQIQPITNNVLDYTISASFSGPESYGGVIKILKPTESIDIQNVYNSSSGYFIYNNTPNTQIIFTASFDLASPQSTPFFTALYLSPVSNSAILSKSFPVTGTPISHVFSGSFYPIQNQPYYFYAITTDIYPTAISNFELSFTQSRTVTSSICEPVIFEPYITTANFYNSDENALLNNAFNLRNNLYYLDVDYSRGIMTPVNFSQLIDGSATKAKVQDSNYTTLRHIIPRYLGSRSTSQLLNTWSPPNTIGGYSDQGTFGKLPTIENLNSYVVYAPSIGGWPPERMNTSAVFIKYLIDQNGDAVIPNTSENSLSITQQNFRSGDRIKITSPSQGSGEATQFRKIIRGGSRIEPILYTQSGSTPNIYWSSINLEDKTPGDSNTVVRDVKAGFNIPYTAPPGTGWGVWHSVDLTVNIVYQGANASTYSNGYEVSLAAVQDGVGLKFENGSISNFHFRASAGSFGKRPETNVSYLVELIRINTSNITTGQWTLKQGMISRGVNYGFEGADTLSFSLASIDIPPQDVKTGDKYFLRFSYYSDHDLDQVWINGGTWKINQYPNPFIPINPASSTGSLSAIWGFYDKTNYPNIITCSNPSLNDYFNNPEIKQQDTPASGFNPIALPWSVKYGDEFRFEGREDYTYQVYKVFSPLNNSPERITPTGSIEIQFNQNLPISASLTQFNLDHFLIRRYVDDASQILIEGFKPIGTEGPYIITPEYITPSLNKNADTFITDLTERGLL